jgi:hypothetical protein
MDALYRRTGHWEALISVFRRRIELAEEGVEREAIYAQMAQVYEEKLGKPDDAILAYREVLALDPTSRVALDALDALFTRRSMWSELAENLEVKLGLAENEDEQLGFMLRLAALREGQMGIADEAIEGYRQVLDRDPTNRAALTALERLGASEANALTIAEILEPLYRSQGAHQKLIGVHEVQVARTDDPHRKVELLHQISELYEDAAGDATRGAATPPRPRSWSRRIAARGGSTSARPSARGRSDESTDRRRPRHRDRQGRRSVRRARYGTVRLRSVRVRRPGRVLLDRRFERERRHPAARRARVCARRRHRQPPMVRH